MRTVLLASAFVLLVSATANAQAPAPCEGRTGVVDGIDEDGVVCDYAAQQAALARFKAATEAADAAKFVQQPCDPQNRIAVKTKLDGAQEWINASTRASREEVLTDRQIAQIQEFIAAEKANPTGVVNLARLHQLGEDLQAQRALKVREHAEATSDRGRASGLMAEASKEMGACKKGAAH